jgi:uncharacterized protein
MTREPRVRLEVRRAYYRHDVHYEDSWPVASVQPVRLYLCASTSELQRDTVKEESSVQYRSTGKKEHDRASFSFRFDDTTELTGSMRLKLWVSTSEGDDLDLFLVIRNFDSANQEVFFSGFNGYERDAAAKGWLRASHRELDESRSTPLRPWLNHTQIQKLRPNEIVPLEIEIWPSSTLFEAGSTLQISIQGHDAAKYPAFGHRRLVNHGLHSIFTGGRFDSHLVIPVNQSRSLHRERPATLVDRVNLRRIDPLSDSGAAPAGAAHIEHLEPHPRNRNTNRQDIPRLRGRRVHGRHDPAF